MRGAGGVGRADDFFDSLSYSSSTLGALLRFWALILPLMVGASASVFSAIAQAFADRSRGARRIGITTSGILRRGGLRMRGVGITDAGVTGGGVADGEMTIGMSDGPAAGGLGV